MLEFTRQYIEEKGGEVLGEEYLPMDGSDWTAVISQLKSANPDALITCRRRAQCYADQAVAGSRGRYPYGNLAVDEGTAKNMGADAAGIYISASYITGIDSAETKHFLAAMAEHFGDDLKTPNDLSVPQYEAVYSVQSRAGKAGSIDPQAVIDALGEVEVMGPRD